eukprot:symbB.v1.2.005100.t1/scaffold234.1/size257806/19
MNKPMENASVGTSVGGMRLPLLRPQQEEVHVWVDAERGGSILAHHASEALQSRELRVAVDAEWQDPRPLSLLQLALSVRKQPPTVFLIDMVQPPSESTLEWCRKLLTGEHEVLVFSPKEDSRRLEEVGLLPGVKQENWLDLQRLDWGLGNQPGLQAVAAWALGRWMDKSLQTSNWDQRPLTRAQQEYAALDASVLLRLHDCDRATLPKRAPKVQVQSPHPLTSNMAMTQQKERWNTYRADPQRRRPRIVDAEGARERNEDLCFMLPAALTRLMRKLRGLGLDTMILREGAPQRELVETAEDEDRIILYYNTKNLLPARVFHRTYMLQSTSPDEQLREIIEAFDVDINSDCLCGRCVQCNAWDWQLVGREDVKDNPQVAARTLESFDEFWLCGGCGKIYWEGKMFVKALGHFRGFMPESSDSSDRQREGQIDARSQELEDLGWSASRIRAALVREGWLSAEKALEDEEILKDGYSTASSGPFAPRVSACGRQGSRAFLAVMPALCLFAGRTLSPVVPRNHMPVTVPFRIMGPQETPLLSTGSSPRTWMKRLCIETPARRRLHSS